MRAGGGEQGEGRAAPPAQQLSFPFGRKALQGRAALPADAAPPVPGCRSASSPCPAPSRAEPLPSPPGSCGGGRDSSEPGAVPGQRLPLPFIAASTKHIICQGRSGGARSGAARSGAERGGGGQEAGRAGPGPGREPPQQQPPPAASAEAEPRRAAIPRPR